MGLPIWRDPEEKKESVKNTARTDPTAALRSSIRRRPSIHRRTFPRPPAWQSLLEPLRSTPGSPPPPPAMSPPPPLPVPAPASRLSMRNREILDRIRNIQRTGDEARTRLIDHQISHLRNSGGEQSFGAGRQETRQAPEVPPRSSRRSLLPTPPLEVSEQNTSRESQVQTPVPTISVQPAAGLGDRVRSPSPAPPQEDAWQIIRETIPADGNLPSAESSFASAAASSSFNSTANAVPTDTQSTAPDHLANPSETQSSHDQEMDCIYDSDNSTSTFIPTGVSPFGYTPASLQGLRDSIREEMHDGFDDIQQDFQTSLSEYEDEMCSLRHDYNALRDHLQRLDPNAQLPPPYPPFSPAARGPPRTYDEAMGPSFTTSHRLPYPPAYDPAIHARSRDAISRTEAYFTPYFTPYTTESQYHLGVDRDGQLQHLPRDRTLTRVPSLRREESQREPRETVQRAALERHLDRMREERQEDTSRAAARHLAQLRHEGPPPGRGEEAGDVDTSLRGILDRLSRRQDVPDGMWMGAGLSRDVVEPRPGVDSGEGAEARSAGSGRVAGRGRVGRL
ncbi:hypothetical protein C1H76_2036 [Elsinoe australis]|uniref:Uncharacterized protein n=1 Tax=Elsinoe australis TaxID=40998 RepID=A0A4U7B2F2_9PEZI|nr:hypothetical protein C1H76_2036 [Elsinoe australis]